MLNLKTENPTMAKPQMQTTRPSHQSPPTNHGLIREDNENFGMGLFFGLVAAIGGACLWAFITAMTEYQIGWMAIGVGFMTGWAVRMGGKGTSQSFGIAGACLALFGCMLGNLMTSSYFIAKQYDTGFFDVFFSLDGAAISEIFTGTFQPMDILFYGLAIYAGYRYSRVATIQSSSKS
jgi:hypothetical protein